MHKAGALVELASFQPTEPNKANVVFSSRNSKSLYVDPNQSCNFHPAVLVSWLVLTTEFAMKWWSMFQLSALKPYYH